VTKKKMLQGATKRLAELFRHQGAQVSQETMMDLVLRYDLEAIGFVVAARKPVARQCATFVVWAADGSNMRPGEAEVAIADATKRLEGDHAATIFAFAQEVAVIVRHDWRGAKWLTDYVEQLAKEIGDAGGVMHFLAACEPLGERN
jgi:hypothetical protein